MGQDQEGTVSINKRSQDKTNIDQAGLGDNELIGGSSGDSNGATAKLEKDADRIEGQDWIGKIADLKLLKKTLESIEQMGSNLVELQKQKGAIGLQLEELKSKQEQLLVDEERLQKDIADKLLIMDSGVKSVHGIFESPKEQI